MIKAVAAAKHRPPHLAAGNRAKDRRIRWASRGASPRPRRSRFTAPSISTSVPASSAASSAARARPASRSRRWRCRFSRARDAQDIPVEDAPLVPIFDWRQIKRWGIDPVAAAAGFEHPILHADRVGSLSSVHHRNHRSWFPPSCWRSRDCWCSEPDDAGPKQTVLAREATIRASYDRIRQLAGRLINAQEAARADIARDLHDGVCQELAGVSFAVGQPQ